MTRARHNLGIQAAGAPSHMARLRFHESPACFRRGLEIAKECGVLKQACQTKKDVLGKNTWTTCTWRANGRIVAASANQGRVQNLKKANLWTDKDLLRGHCPR